MPSSTVDLNTYKRNRRSHRRPRTPRWRLRFLQVCLLLAVMAIGARLYYLQIKQGDELKENARIQRQKSVNLVHRGAITDRHGLPLAIDTTRYDVFVHTKLLKKDKKEAAKILARITGQPEPKVYSRLTGRHHVVTIAQHIEREAADELQDLNWTGVDIISRPFRHYPEGVLAAPARLRQPGDPGSGRSRAIATRDTHRHR